MSLIVGSSWAATQKMVVATLTDVRGTIEIKAREAAEWTAVKSTQLLYEGDAVKAGKGGRALLLQPSCAPRVLKEGEAAVVSANKRWASGISNKPVTREQFNALVKLFGSAAESSRSKSTAVRPQNPHADLALSPRFENVVDGRPTFVWHDCGSGCRYEVEVFDGNKLVWEAKTTETRLAYPADRAPLKAGRYTWQVYARMRDRVEHADGAAFTMLDDAAVRRTRAECAAAQALVPEGAGVNLLLIDLYVTHRLYTQAEAALLSARKVSPDDTTLCELLAHVYSLAKREQARMELLRRTLPTNGG